jgi:hypothetical protein
MERAALLSEWLATRFGSRHPEQVANVLTFGRDIEPGQTTNKNIKDK